MDKEYSCFFTGHRIIAANKISQLEKNLRKKIKSLIEDKGVTDFITGGAIGFDTMAAQAVISLREEYPYIRLHIYFPCKGSMKKWNDSQRFAARIILSKSDSYIYVSDSEYFNGCMQIRNKKMADDARYCIAYCERKNSGTKTTVDYAEKINDYVYDIMDE
ncbi:MAG: DUF1273 domain-containing protein [Firmicutes bacterium]|nr:DUF1273 domain-containing protein [Bacillota bacterium]